MNKKELINECKKLYLNTRKTNDRNIIISRKLENEFFLLTQLDKDDQEIRVYQILSAYFISIGRFDAIVEEIKRTQIFKKSGYHLLVLIAYLEDMWMADIHEDTYQLLERFDEPDKSRQSVIELMKAWSFEYINNQKYVQALHKACELDPTIPQPFIELGLFLIDHGEQVSGKDALRKAVANFKQVTEANENSLTELDPDLFIDCLVKHFYPDNSFRERIAKMAE